MIVVILTWFVLFGVGLRLIVLWCFIKTLISLFIVSLFVCFGLCLCRIVWFGILCGLFWFVLFCLAGLILLVGVGLILFVGLCGFPGVV